MEESTRCQLMALGSENVQLRAAIKKATLQLQLLESSPNLFNEQDQLKQLFDETKKKMCHLECEKADLLKALHDQQVEGTRKITALENMLVEFRAKPCSTRGAQTMLQQITVGCATEPPKVADECVGICGNDTISTSCQTTVDTVDFHDQETWCDCKSENAASLKFEETKLEEVVQGLQSSVSKMIVSECQVKQDKARIAELETQLSCAWRTRDCEVQAARTCREQEILNLKQVIDNLIKNLDNEKLRSDNLQRAVDVYHETIDSIKESESRFKEEVMGQKRTIQNLQDALIRTKQSLEELREKSNIECQEHTILVEKLITIVSAAEKEIQNYVVQCEEFGALVEKLRDENIKLEENLFYNHQDLEMYEMRLAKYQSLYNQVEAQCGELRKELQIMEAQKCEKDIFVHDLSENLADCQMKLTDLFAVLNEEKNEKEDQSGQIAELQLQLKLMSEKLELAMHHLEIEKDNNARLAKSLKKNKCVTTTIKNETMLAHEKLQEAALKISSDEQKIAALSQQICEYQEEVGRWEQSQNIIKQQLEMAQLELNNRCPKCDEFNEQILQIQAQHDEDLDKYQNTVQNLSDKIVEKDIECKKCVEEMESYRIRLSKTDCTESKLKQDLIDTETKYHTQINQYHSEQERLITVVTNLEHQISMMNMQLLEKERLLQMLKNNLCGQEKLREKQEEIIHLKNEINTLIQTQGLLKSDNEKLQLQLGHVRASLAANDEKHKLIITELEACINDLHNDKDFLVRKNDQLMQKMQALQEQINSKGESLASLEMELTEAKFTRECLCNESKQVIEHVKCWLEEQRKINLELNERLKHKNDVINKLKQDKKSLAGKLKQVPVYQDTVTKSSSTCSYQRGQAQHPQYTMQVLHSPPPPRRGWSLGSVDSAPCSLIDDSDWEPDNGDENEQEPCPQVWIHRVESLTEELQRSNLYWKSKMTEQDYSVSRDK